MNTNHSITKLIGLYLDNRDIMPTSKRIYGYVIKYFFSWMVVAGRNAKQPETSDVVAYKTYLKQERKRPQTIDLYINSIRGFFRWLNDRGIHSNITLGVRSEKRGKSFSRDPLSVEQVSKLIISITKDGLINMRDRAMISLIYFNGLRVIEASRIYHSDIDFIGSRVFIQGKGQNEKRPVDINANVVQAIEEYIQTKMDYGIELSEEEPLFQSHSRKSMLKVVGLTSTDISHIISNRMRDVGIKSRTITAHSLRHSAAVHMIDGGFDLYAVQLFLRHSDSNTSQIYTRYAEKAKLQSRAPTKYLQSQFKQGNNHSPV